MKEGYGIGTGYDTRLESDTLTLHYEGGHFTFLVLTPENKARNQIYIYINPTKPLEAPSQDRPHDIVISSESISTSVPVKNWGTNHYLDDNLTNEVRGGMAMLRNTQTGKVIPAEATFNQTDSGYINVQIPDTIEAGEYDLTLTRNNRSVVVPDKVVIRYGEPFIRIPDFISKSTYNQGGYVLSYRGYNIKPGHRYEMVLSSDLTGTQKIPMTPKSHMELQVTLPPDMPQGSYQAGIHIDDKPVNYVNLMTDINLVHVRENENQPTIALLSQRSQFYRGPVGGLYHPITRFNRNEDIVLLAETKPHILAKEGQGVARMILDRVDGEGTYELPLSDSIAPALLSFFPQFKITDNIPLGRYKTRISIQENEEATPRVSGPYYRIITIE